MTINTTRSTDLHEVLIDNFGFNHFIEGQEAVITRLVEGRSVLSIFPTGGGKSLCYQLPALLLDGMTVVISPLIALMKDQLDFLVGRGVAAARLDSSLDRDETLAVYDKIHSGTLKLLYISPERLGNERFLQTLRRLRISLLAIDEAHCISEWGHNFRPDYLKIAELARELSVERVLALTATATPQVADDIARAFGIAKDDVVHTGFHRPNLNLRVSPCNSHERNTLLLSRLRERPPGPAIVYVTLQKTSEEVAELLCRDGFDAHHYHAGMKTEDRTVVQDTFMSSDKAIIVATIAFGMGIDKSDIRYIYHYNLPKGLESYSQEIGRAGRDGKESICELLGCAEDVVVLENFSYGDTPGHDAVTSLVTEVLGLGNEFSVSIYDLSRNHDIRLLVVKTLLTYLELEKVIESTGPFYTGYKFQPQRPSNEIIADFDEKRADFLRQIFRHAKKGKIWFSLDVNEVSEFIGESRDRIIAALNHLEEKDYIVLQASGIRQGYRLRRIPEDMPAFCESLSKRFLKREKNDITRIHGILKYAEHESCLTGYLIDYFGETLEECGHCSRCEGDSARPLPKVKHRALDGSHIKKLSQLRTEKHEALTTPRQITRFLCGIASPATTKAKLRKHPMFGVFETLPFNKVMDFVEERMKI